VRRIKRDLSKCSEKMEKEEEKILLLAIKGIHFLSLTDIDEDENGENKGIKFANKRVIC